MGHHFLTVQFIRLGYTIVECAAGPGSSAPAMQQPGISGNRMGSSGHNRSMKRLSRRLSCLSLVLCLTSFADAGAAGRSDEDGERADSARLEKAGGGVKETEQALLLYERIESVE